MLKGHRLGAFAALATITVIGLAATLSVAAPAVAGQNTGNTARSVMRPDGTQVTVSGAVTPQDAGNNGASVTGVGQCANWNTNGDCWTWVNTSTGTPCPFGHFCIYTNAFLSEGGKAFKFFHCLRGGSDWALQNWNGTGFYSNNNSGGAGAYLKDVNHNNRPNMPIPPQQIDPVNYHGAYNYIPVWFVRAC